MRKLYVARQLKNILRYIKCPKNTHFDEDGNYEQDFPDCGEDLILNEDNKRQPIE